MMNWTLARPDCILTPARGNENTSNQVIVGYPFLVPKFHLGMPSMTLRVIPFLDNAERCGKAFQNGVWEREKNGVWEREKNCHLSFLMMNWTLARPDCIPTPARGNEKTRKTPIGVKCE